MQRRQFFRFAGTGAAALAFPHIALAARKAPKTGHGSALQEENVAPWHDVEVTTKVRMAGESSGKVWLPMPLEKTSYQVHGDTTWSGNFTRAGLMKDPVFGSSFFYAEWDKAGPVELDATFRVKVRDRSVVERAPASEAELYLKPSEHIPTDGIVAVTAQQIVGKEKDADAKARLIYEWMVENTQRDAKVRGCGQGDVKAILDSGKLLGKCADLSSLYVGLCRASGVPAREMFGLRVAPSKLSASIGKAGGDVSGAQHCRAEYYSAKRGGWVPVDPADVRKVILEEKKSLGDAPVALLREKFFGFWEMNWVAFNSARDFALPPSNVKVNYLMYPYYAAGTVMKDGMDPKTFTYQILAKEMALS